MPIVPCSPTPPRPIRRTRSITATTAALLALTVLLGAPTGAAGGSALAPPGAGRGSDSPVTAAVPVASAPATEGDAYVPPVAGARVVTIFRGPALRWSAGHRGVDLAAAPGDPVLAPAPGVVTFQGVVVDRSVVVVTHPDGLRTSLEPVVGTLDLGSAVARGDVLGTVEDRAGHCPEPCVHWGVRRGTTYLDPLGLLAGAGPVVLLPVPP